MKKTILQGCFVACGVLLVLAGLSIAVFGPRAAREGQRLAVPVIALMGNGQRFGNFLEAHHWHPPAADALTAGQLRRFLAVRARIHELCARHAPAIATLPDDVRIQSLDDAADALELLQSLIPEQMAAYMEQEMTPAEYRYVDNLVYGRWRAGLRTRAAYPGTREVAAAELESLAAGEADAAVAARLYGVARDLRARPVPPPDGVSVQIHELLLAHREEIERLSLDAYRHLPFPEL